MAKTALVTTTIASRIDCSQMTDVAGLAIVSAEPAGTATKYALKTAEGAWRKWGAAQAWEDLPTQSITAESLLAEGNSKAELLAVAPANLKWLAGAKIDAAVALTMNDAAAGPPAVASFAVNGTTGAVVHEKTITSDSIILSDVDSAVDILDIKVEKAETAGGAVEVKASIQRGDGVWSGWQAVSSCVTTPATAAKAMKLQAVLTAPAIGVSRATLAGVSIRHRTDNIAVLAEGTGTCITKTYNFIRQMRRAHLMVKRPVVKDTEVKAYISLRPKPESVSQEVLGVGDGAQHDYTLKHPVGVAAHTFALQFDGVRQTAGFTFSSADGKVVCAAPAGVSITADYDYNWRPEQFAEMAYDAQYPDTHNPQLVNDQFNYLAAAESDPKGAVSVVRIDLIQKKGAAVGEAVGAGSGALQSYKLAHNAKAETLAVKAGGSPLARENWSYKDKTSTLFVTAPQGAAITADYEWAAGPVYIEEFTCLWNE